MPPKFISRMQRVDGSWVPVKVVEADLSHAEAWDRDVQLPWISATNRIDSKWRWRTLYLRSTLLEIALGRHLAYLQLTTPMPNGEVFVLGQVLLADGYPFPTDRSKPCVFLWYLSGAPHEAALAAGIPPVKGLLRALVDSTIQFSYMRGYAGRISLHASPTGTAEQQDELLQRYENVGLYLFEQGKWAGWFRRNDQRYFTADEELSVSLSLTLDTFR